MISIDMVLIDEEVSIGVIVDVNPIEERKVPGGKVDMLSIRLKDIRYRIYIILTQPLCVVACVH
jgi:hypothetical protein